MAAAAAVVVDEFMCQTWGTTPDEMYDNGMAISMYDRERIVIKVPVTTDGAKAASMLARDGVRICLTACYDSRQALIASSVGAEYIAPYLGRMTDAGKDGLEECKKMQDIADGLGSDTRILVASIRDVETISDLAIEGLDTYTFAPAVARMMFDVPLTVTAAGEFEEAAARGRSSREEEEEVATATRGPSGPFL